MQTEVTKLLGIRYPCIQGGMAWVADASLAAGVSNAGGLGLIAAANAPVDLVREEIRKAKMLTDRPFGVNIMLMSPSAVDIAQLIIDEQVPVVTTGAGSPVKFMEAWKAAGIKIIPVIATVAQAIRMERSGADAVVAEGCEAGGHIGELTTMVLTPAVCDAVEIPVLAAGGIADGRGVAAAMILGAKGVQVGTRFLVARECTVHPAYKEMVLKARDVDTTVTGRITGHPVRGLKNRMTREINALEKEDISPEELEERLSGTLRAAVQDGDVKHGSVMAGQCAALVTKEQSCAEILEEIFAEADALLGNRA